jgi:hypothetical protein
MFQYSTATSDYNNLELSLMTVLENRVAAGGCRHSLLLQVIRPF